MRKFITHHYYLMAFLLPVIIMLIYFIVRGVYPFGNSSVLTVDMGQQYIDFYSYFRQTILGHPGQLFYGFNKALGGDMYGTFAYYLLSPFNLVLLVFPKTMLDVAVFVMTLLKYGAASLSMAWFMKKQGWHGWWLVSWGLAYALSGWMLANQLNLMWFDGAIALPLIAWGVEHLVTTKRVLPYILWLAAGIIVNYYIGYMICLFLIGYFGFNLVRHWAGWRAAGRTLLRFGGASALGGGIAAVVVLPTLYQLSQSKGTYTVTSFTWKFEYAPYKLLGKLIAGAFSFDQMPNGQANIFVGSLALIGFLLYFFISRIPWRERLAALLWSLFLLASLMLEPLDLLWHGMQWPSWYPYRFSFVVVFWLIMLGARALQHLPNGLAWWQMLLSLAMVVGLCLTVWLNLLHFKYLTTTQVMVTGALGIAAIILLSVRNDHRRFMSAIFLLFMTIDLTSNMVFTLNQLSYITHSDYHTYTEALRAGNDVIAKRNTHGDRVGKTVMRTKNDAMEVGFAGTDQFNSMMEPTIQNLYRNLGQPIGDGFVAYTDGTLITDALFDLKYWLDPRNGVVNTTTYLPQTSRRPDITQRYTKIGHSALLAAYENPYALGLGFVANRKILTTKTYDNMPVINQELILAGLTSGKYQSLYHMQTLTGPTLVNAKLNHQTQAVKKIDPGKTASITYTFNATSTDPYYLQIPAAYSDSVVSITQNGQELPLQDTFRGPLLLNVTPASSAGTQTITITLNKRQTTVSDVVLYRLDAAAAIAKLNTLKQAPWHITHKGDRSISGTVNVTGKNRLLMTTIPYAKGWHVTVDGKTVTPKKALKTFIAIPLSPGQHHISLRYTPPWFWVGLLISVLAAALTGLWWFLTPHGKHRLTNK